MPVSSPSPLKPQGMIEKPQASYRKPLIAAFVFVAAVHLIIAAGVLTSGCRQEKVAFEDLATDEGPPPIENEWSETVDDIPPAPVEGGSARSPFGSDSAPVTADGITTEVLPPAPGGSGPRFNSQDSRARVGGGMVAPATTEVAETPAPAVPEVAAAPVAIVDPPATVPSSGEGFQEYKIRSGDSFYKIASRFNVNFKDIERANPNVDPRRLQIGQSIRVPIVSGTTAPASRTAGSVSAPGSTTSAGRIHKVRSGDNLSSLAVRYKTTVDRIMKANNLRSSRINIGQDLVIPAP